MFLSGSGARRLYRKWAWVWHVASGRCHKFTNNWLHGFRSRLMNGFWSRVFLFVFHFRSRVLNSWLHGFRTRVHQQLTAWLPATSSSTADCMASGHVHSTADWLLVTCSLFYFPFPVGLFCSPSDWSTRMLLPPVWFPEIYINNNKKSPLILLPVCTVHCSHR